MDMAQFLILMMQSTEGSKLHRRLSYSIWIPYHLQGQNVQLWRASDFQKLLLLEEKY